MNKPIEIYIQRIRVGKHYISSAFELKKDMIETTYKGVTYTAESIYKIGMMLIMHRCSLGNEINVQVELMEFIDHCNLHDTVIKKVKK